MIKTFLIGIKDLRLAFRDRAALIFMLLAPFLLTIGMGFVTGRFSGNTAAGFRIFPSSSSIWIMSNWAMRWRMSSTRQDLADLMEPTASSDPEAARQLIDEDEAAAVVIIPEGFTQSHHPAAKRFRKWKCGGGRPSEDRSVCQSIPPDQRGRCQSHRGRILSAASKKGASAA